MGEPFAQPLELGDASLMRVVQLAEIFAQSDAPGRAILRELGQLRRDLVEGEAHPLREDDEGDPPQHGSRIAPMAGTGALGFDEAALLVEAKGGGGNAAARDAISRRWRSGAVRP